MQDTMLKKHRLDHLFGVEPLRREPPCYSIELYLKHNHPMSYRQEPANPEGKGHNCF